MTARIQVVLSERERELFRRQAKAEGLSLSAWFKRAAYERLAGSRATRGFGSAEDLQAFFERCDQREKGREPDWEEHLEVIERSRRSRRHVIFVDTNVFMYAVGRHPPLQAEGQGLL